VAYWNTAPREHSHCLAGTKNDAPQELRQTVPDLGTDFEESCCVKHILGEGVVSIGGTK